MRTKNFLHGTFYKKFQDNNSLAVVLLGNFLEIFEFSLYGIFAKEFSDIFFKGFKGGLIYSLGIFSVGFLARPLGSVFFGHIGDRYGRRRALILCIMLMSFATFGIAILPSPEKMGLFAPMLLLFFRILQGFSCGGEYIGLTIFLFEAFPRKPGLAGACAATSGMSGTLAAIFISYVVNLHISFSWYWRIPFLLSSILGLIIIYLRTQLQENTRYAPGNSLDYQVERYPIKEVFKHHLGGLLATFCIGGCNGILTFTLVVYFNIFLLQHNAISLAQALNTNFYAVCFFIVSGLIFGVIYDKGHIASVVFLKIISIIVFGSSFFIYQQLCTQYIPSMLFGEILLAILAGSFSACCNVVMCQLFPSHVRYSGMALGYSLGVCMLGGTVPLICSLLIQLTNNLYTPALCLNFGAMMGLVACIIGKKYLKHLTNVDPLKHKSAPT